MKDSIFSTEYIFLDQEFSSKERVFSFIASQALKLNLVSNKEALVKGFLDREKEGSTGFEDGFAIPHARIMEIKKSAVFVVRLKSPIDWNSLDGKPTKIAIALMIPEGPSGEEHLTILSSIAMKLLNTDFKRKILSTNSNKEVLELLQQVETKENIASNDKKTSNDGLKIVAITACITGIAHTYMAEEKLLSEVPKMGHSIRIETQGSKGVGTPLKPQEIADADLVIFATDTSVDKTRFAGKKVYQTKVAKAMKDPQGTVKLAIAEATLQKGENPSFQTKNRVSGEKEGVMQHIMAGISYMIPIIVLGGICLAFSIGLAKAIWGPEAGTAGPNDQYKWGILNVMNLVGSAAFAMMIPILGGFIANSIAGRAAIVPAMVGAFLGNNPDNFMPMPGMDAVATPAGFLGAIAAGLLAGYTVKWINTWNVPKTLQAAMPIFFIPIVVGLGIGLLFIYVIGGPIGYVMDQISIGFKNAYNSELGVWAGLGLGMALGAMAGFDMGGPINKIAFVTGSALVTAKIYEPMGAIAAAIPVAPLGMGLTTIIVPKFFDKDTRNLGVAAIIMGCIGISEGAIPFAIRDPKRAVVSNVLGSAVAGGIAGALMVTNAAAHGGPIVAILGAVPYGVETLYFFIAIAAGVATTASVYSFWLLTDAGKPGSVKETHVAYLLSLNSEKKVALADINEKIKTAKVTAKFAVKDAKMKNENADAILFSLSKTLKVLVDKKAMIIEKYKSDVEKAKMAYKEISKLESEFVKTKNEQVKKFVAQNTEDYQTKLSKINSDFKNNKFATNKMQVHQNKSNLLEAKQELKEQKQSSFIQYQTNLRKQFVEKYYQSAK
ncbi:PTS fructose transporter subunit IIB [Mesoplasma syrphidae]|uniref:PTS fructose transporter subunit IIB n=1 Tax=Mesoplasma syrphidae TaxID=225999 RepID=A0A2K9BVI4_9MOLU|nr:fructose-specific PTS transporter subunit EIIC [Mesoplasma syrphidae]AUF83730.1 PTS fructose transporter subunit IIB [Mesoplasma syrphidae]